MPVVFIILIKLIILLEKCYVDNIFTTFSKLIINNRLLLNVMDKVKNNLSCKFKLELITTYHLGFIVKIL